MTAVDDELEALATEVGRWLTQHGWLLATAPYARPPRVGRETAVELAALCAAWIAAQPLRPPGARRAPRWLRAAWLPFARSTA